MAVIVEALSGLLARLKSGMARLIQHLPFKAAPSEEGSLRWLRAVMRASIIVPLILLSGAAIHSYFEADAIADARVDRDVRVVQEHALKVLETAASVAGRIDDVVGNDPAAMSHDNEASLHEKFRDISTAMPQLLSVWLTDADGRAIASDRYYPVPLSASLATREFFQQQRNNPLPIAISGLLRGSMSGQNFFSLSRRRESADGEFLGVISVGLSEAYFSSFYASIGGENKDLAVELIREDGTPLVSFPERRSFTGKLAADSPIMQAIRSGSLRGKVHAGLDGTRRLVAVRKVGNYPVYAVAGALRSTTLSQWRSRMLLIIGFVLPATIAMVLLCWTALRKVGREHRALAQWRDEVSRRVTAEEALMRAQKMDAIGQMTGGVAHDFNNMLQIISSNIHIIRLKLPQAGIEPQLAAIDRARLSGESLTRQLLAFSRQQALRPESINIDQRMPSICELIRHSLGTGIQLESETEPGTWPIEVDPSQLDLALFNLAINSRDAMPEGGTIRLYARNVSAAERGEIKADLRGDFVAIVVSDTGQGVPAEIADRIFEPFFTTKDVGKGTGLGLSQVFGFATQSGGTVTLRSTPGAGTTLTVYLPRAHAQGVKRTNTEPVTAGEALHGRLLVVEDNLEVGDGLTLLLGEVGFTVTLKRSAVEAMQALEEGQKFDLLLTDLVMPGNFNGLQLARLVMREYPDLPVVLMTGYSDEVRKASAEGFTILIKPFQMSALLAAIRERIDCRKEAPDKAQAD
ncbi:ATP-binding protein [Uliginosibacterium sp. H3]|uniref:histidine kinase n=1 Tax=Uliginosibacterium silvisoli TaxID=3114758 RepID=A0ABU6KA66_9RHOO|nr:ATP-binding protein [Uliginosibacterium sp. H3]